MQFLSTTSEIFNQTDDQKKTNFVSKGVVTIMMITLTQKEIYLKQLKLEEEIPIKSWEVKDWPFKLVRIPIWIRYTCQRNHLDHYQPLFKRSQNKFPPLFAVHLLIANS